MKIKVIRVVPVTLASWRAVYDAFKAMKLLFVIALLAVIGPGLLRLETLHASVFGTFPNINYLQLTVWLSALALFEIAVLSIVAIAVHRFVLLSERASKETLVARPRRLLIFALHAGVPMLIYRLSLLWLLILMPLTPPDATRYVAILLLDLLAWTLLSMMVMLFPAIAVDAAGASLSNAWRDSRRHYWRILLAIGCVLIPMFVLTNILDARMSFDSKLASQVTVVYTAIFLVAATAAFAACGSYVYLCYATALARPAAMS